MGLVFCWGLFACLVTVVTPSATQCPDKDLSIVGGTYTLTRRFEEDSVLHYQCPAGHYPYPHKKRQCRDGAWDPKPRRRPVQECRVVTCPNPLVLENGNVSPYQPRYYVGNVTEYACHSDYTLRGSSTRRCKENGKWTGVTPICGRDTDHCPDPGIPAGASRTGHIFNIDDKVTYRCDRPLILLGSKQRVCTEGGQWTGKEPECYYDYTYDTPEEVSEAFGNSLGNSLAVSEFEGLNRTQFGRKIQLRKGGNLHIYIALDASDSIDPDDFEQSKRIVKKLIDKISVYEVTPKYEIFVFATDVHEVIDIVDFYNNPDKTLAERLKQLDESQYDDKGDASGTNIAKAFSTIHGKMTFVKQREPEFDDIRHVIIMFTDGVANMGGRPRPKVEQIKELIMKGNPEREEYLDLYVFGVGEDVQQEDVDEYVTKRPKEKHFFILKDLENLEETFDEMIDESSSVDLCGTIWNYDSTNPEEKRIKHPWLAEISVIRSLGQPISNCMGSLVTPRFVLTAAHCFNFLDTPDKIKVIIEDGTSSSKKVKNLILHPKFNINAKKDKGISETYDYDVALLELEKNATISRRIRPLCIPCTEETSRALRLSGDVTCEKHRQVLLNKQLEPAAFMTKDNTDIKKKNVTIKLRDARLACIADAKRVIKGVTDNEIAKITEQFLCSGGTEPKVDDISCKGDSGGAVVMERHSRVIQVGIVSWGVADLCKEKGEKLPQSEEHTRDFHIDLFKVQDFLRKHLGKTDADYTPLNFLS
ncbi:complement factor B-like [Chanos chanos]|uniref:C3/C5 convertase n=1 Tax=Chanos chanos TaxID=29144 RepID=A0A6J2UW95_CHACN|nr:complement factor B-like [Chanos chanos]